MTDQEKAREFQRRRNMAHRVEHVDGGKRSMTVVLKHNQLGDIGSCTIVYARGKETDRLYVLPKVEGLS